MMDPQQVFTFGQQGLYMLMLVAAPVLLAVLVVGVVVSVIQAPRRSTRPRCPSSPRWWLPSWCWPWPGRG